MNSALLLTMPLLILIGIGIIIEVVCSTTDDYTIASQLSEEEKTVKLIKELKEIPNKCPNEDYEEYHVLADKLLLKFIDNEEVTKAFNDIPKYYA